VPGSFAALADGEGDGVADFFGDAVGVGVADGSGVLGCGAVMHHAVSVTFVSSDL
jgi:hypothetical protein